ncbi:MAG: hypothetical protein ACR2IJ_05880 [Fluviibacter sp.]
MDMIQVLAEQAAGLRDERDRLHRENSILRQELKYRLSSEHWEMNHDMSIEEADRLAERDIIQMVAHNEGAE